jgi:transposase
LVDTSLYDEEESMTKSRKMRRVFTAEFKREAVQLLEQRREAGVALTRVARELGLRPAQLREWATQVATETAAPVTAVSPSGETLEQEVRRLRRENARLEEEAAFAKEAAAFFARESR